MQSENDRRRRRPGAAQGRRGGGFSKFLLGTVLLLVVIGGILSFVDIGGGMILDVAQKAMREQMGLELTARGVSGNPIKGYALHEFAVSSSGGERILSARSLSASVSFAALFRGALRLAEVSVGGIDMDLDQFIEEIQKIDLPEGEGGGEIPVDRVSMTDSRFTSKWGTVDVSRIGVDIHGQRLAVDVDGRVNGVPVKGGGGLDVGTGGTFAIDKSDVSFGRGKIFATGGVRPAPDGRTTLDMQGSVQGLDLKELTALWPTALSPDDYDGTVDMNVEIRGPSEAIEIDASADYRGTRLGGYPVERVGATARWAGERLTISNIQASALNVPITGEAAVATRPGEHPSIMIDLEGGEADLGGLGKTFPAMAGVGGRVSAFSAKIHGPTDALNGTIHLTAPRVSYEGRAIEGIAVQLKLAKSDTATVNGKFTFEGAKGFIQGSVSSILSGPKLGLTADLAGLDVSRVAGMIPDASRYAPAGVITAKLAVKGPATAPTVSGTVSAPSFAAAGQTIDKPSVTFAWADDTLTLQKASGTFDGMPISVTGSVGPFTSSSPTVDVDATIAVSPAALKTWVPDVESYALKGNVNAGVKIHGKLPSPEISLVASSPNLQALGMISAKDISVTTALGGDLTKLEEIALAARAASISASGVTFTDVSAKIDKAGDTISLPTLSAKSGSGSITGSGTVALASGGKDAALDLSFALDRLALGPLAAASGVDLKGDLTGKLSVKGTPTAPTIAFDASAPSITVQGMGATDLKASISGTTKALKIDSFKANVGGAPLSATGTVGLSPSVRADVSIRGDALDLAALTKGIDALAGEMSGKADLTFDLSSTEKGTTGKGAVTSSAVKAFGLDLTDVRLPLSYAGDRFTSSGGTAKIYGGTATNTFTYDLGSSKFWDKLEASGVDVDPLVQAASGGLGGHIGGKGKLALDIAGKAAKDVTWSGNGQFSMGAGAITGFLWTDALTRLHGTKGIRYASVVAPFTLRQDRLVLKAGARADAPDGDPLYRWAKIARDGTVRFDKALDLPVEAIVNYQLINALTGGGKAGIDALLKGGAKSLEEGLKQVLGGGIKGAQAGGAEADFRTVTLRVTGRADAPSVADLKIGPSTRKADQPASADQPAPMTKEAGQKAEPKKLKDEVVDKVLDKVLPGSKQPAQPAQPTKQAQPAQPQPQPQPDTRTREEKVKDKVKEELGRELKKGLGELFKK